VTLSFDAMLFAREVHKDQRRKYTLSPYVDHLAEVAGIVSTVCWPHTHLEQEMIAAAWLHDCREDQGVSDQSLRDRFGGIVADAVAMLSDLETGNRAERKAASRDRLSHVWPFVQTIKVADLISNTASIVQHDPGFARVYLEEKRLLLDVLTQADQRLVAVARGQITA
jgi:guanosine-3',5'-bis(diphosphate) 3'-pyrophosphohydrolase